MMIGIKSQRKIEVSRVSDKWLDDHIYREGKQKDLLDAYDSK